ncbi:class I ribonucleotide reductase maintenance protein YfaE [Shewanella sp. SP2S2-4]|uniref:class I ribonucleotide reductase maintenance protein YfaE n=1 Tax=unclassified Shewanella TaxID=196818 RepID=UPI0021757A35|nr:MULTISPECIES: class I ribonucleotide reductase maintenance protein YfaE [unclassified Shewanella]MDT3272704.1 class I ribonucleotide reductase maintenance protein YfaE [Shewanella sp. SP2S2-4]MDT3319060.1 class I ribonucleotide reductase maintenance protein YfaE [Shewanella sp. SP1S2-4]
MTSKKRPQNLFAKAPIVRLQGQPVLLFTEQQGTLLQALEAKKVKIFSECRNGFCGACKTRVISGKVSYLNEPLAELKHDECLPCCCVPTEDLELDLSPEGAAVVTYAAKGSQHMGRNGHSPTQSAISHGSKQQVSPTFIEVCEK